MRGASYVEAVISIPVFLALVLGFIDICRVLLTYIFIQHAAQRAVDWASKVEVEVSTTAAECQPQGSPVDPVCSAYRKRVRDIAERAVERARLVAAPSSQAVSGSRLVRFRHYDTATYLAEGIPLWPELGEGLDLDAAFLRPGEAVREIDPRTNFPVGAPIEHSNRQLIGAVPGEGEEGLGWPGSGESWASLLEAHPIEVIVAVDFDPVMPFFPAFRISATQFAYRAIRAFGIPPRVYTPTPTPVPTPTRTLVPVPTPTVGPTPTYTPTPTATPTLSITPTPTQTATVTPTPTETPVPTPTPTVDCTPCASLTTQCAFEDPMVCAQCSTCPGCNCGSLEEQTG